MLIRSQDKMVLIPIDTGYICVNYRTKKDLIFCGLTGNDENCLTIGNYSSEGKAIKVLDMIQNAYVGCLWTESHYDMAAQANVSDIVANNVVFEMPQDSEV